jgi:hypothetical protein
VHKVIGIATRDAYFRARSEGAEDMGDLVLTMGSDLCNVDFSDAFVGAYDVANKVVELLMQRQGIDICCSSPEDSSLIARFGKSYSADDECPMQ